MTPLPSWRPAQGSERPPDDATPVPNGRRERRRSRPGDVARAARSRALVPVSFGIGARGLLDGVRGLWALETRRTLRTPRTWWVVGGWIALIYGPLVMILATAGAGSTSGTLVHSLVVTLTLAGGLCVAPWLGTAVIVRSRRDGLLDLLRITQFTARGISWGVFAATLTKLTALVAAAVPALGAGAAMGGTGPGGLVGGVVVIAVTLAAAAAVGQAAAARLATRGRALIVAYAATAGLVLGPVLVFGAALPLTAETVSTQVTVAHRPDPASTMTCTAQTEDRVRTRPDAVWWILLPQPFVVLSDASPGRVGDALAFEPLSALRSFVREARLSPPEQEVAYECRLPGDASARVAGLPGERQAEQQRRGHAQALPPHWPLGLGLLAVLGAGAVAHSTARLRAPGPPAAGEGLPGRAPQDS